MIRLVLLGVLFAAGPVPGHEVKPLTEKNIVYTPLFQLRAVEEGSELHWFLYWRRADGTWWPYAGRHHFEKVTDAVAEVIEDSRYCFKLHPLH